jgi:hypothetical protein
MPDAFLSQPDSEVLELRVSTLIGDIESLAVSLRGSLGEPATETLARIRRGELTEAEAAEFPGPPALGNDEALRLIVFGLGLGDDAAELAKHADSIRVHALALLHEQRPGPDYWRNRNELIARWHDEQAAARREWAAQRD